MKITRMYLENFIGIYAGTGRTVIDVDFTKGNNQIIVLSGKNGSGKSTFMSLCHPLRGTLDNRTDIILPGKVGHSICELILDDGRKCVTEHYYGKKNKSFISIDGKELNDNGSIKQFELLAKEYLGIDSDYFRIGKLGSNVSNFIDLSTTQRKTYLNQFIPAVDDYLEAFDIVKEKYKTLTTQIKLIKGTIEKYSKLRELPEIKTHLLESEKNLKFNEKELMKTEKNLENIKDKKKEYLEDIIKVINNSNDEEIIEELQSLENLDCDTIEEIGIYLDNKDLEVNNNLEKYKEYINKSLEKYNIYSDNPLNAIKGLLKKNEKNYTTTNVNIENIIKEFNNISNEIISVTNEIESHNRKINSKDILSEKDIESLKEDIDRYKKEIKIINSSNKLLISNYDEDFLNYIANIPDIILDIKRAINMLSDNLLTIREETQKEIIDKYKNNLPSEEKISKIIREKEKLINDKINTRNDYNEEYNGLVETMKFVKENLNKRPNECSINFCSFIESSVNFMANEASKIPYYEKEIKKLDEEIEALYKEIDKNNKILKFTNDLNKTFNEFFTILKRIYNDEKFTLEKEEFKKTILDVTDIKDNKLIKTLNDSIEYIKNKENKITLESQIELIESKVDNFTKSLELFNDHKEVIESYQKKLNNLNNRKIEIQKEKNDLEHNLEKYEKRIKICENLINIFEEMQLMEKKKENINNIINQIQDKFDKINSLGDEEGLMEKKINLEKFIKASKEDIDDTKTSIRIIEDSLEKLKEIESINESMELVKNALDPKSGIPLIFINSFLTNISQKANRLLKLAYDDSFVIHFDVTAKDFKIEVYKSDGTILKDINEGSQGEQSLTSTSLSLAMIESVIQPGFFNVIYLDEIDATLSTENRRIFIEILDKQLKELGCQQCFVITHNNEFYNHDVDLLLFNEHDCDVNDEEFMKGKTILLNLN